MLNRLRVTLKQDEYSGLIEMAREELRSPDEQMRFLLRQELQRRGLLPICVVASEVILPPNAGEGGQHATSSDQTTAGAK